MYVHQSRVNFKGSPHDFFQLAQSFAAQKGRPRGNLEALVDELGLDPGVLDQPWSELSVSLRAIFAAGRPSTLLLCGLKN
jgi:hypothetical protein